MLNVVMLSVVMLSVFWRIVVRLTRLNEDMQTNIHLLITKTVSKISLTTVVILQH